MAVTRPVLRYHGGKFRLAPWIMSFFPAHSCYVEPFGGAGSVLLLKDRVGAECYNDLDGNIVNIFRILRDVDRALAAVLRAVRGMVVLSGYPSPLYDEELYPDWERFERRHQADGGRARTEVVWVNAACSAALDTERAQGRLI